MSCVNYFCHTGLNCCLVVVGHKDRVLNAALSPDCSMLATISGDETIRLWKSFEVNPVKNHAERTALLIHPSIFKSIR